MYRFSKLANSVFDMQYIFDSFLISFMIIFKKKTTLN